MLRDVNMQDAPTIMTDDEKAIERAEGNSRNSEEVHRGNRFPVIMEKGKPTLGSARISRRSLHPTGDSSLGKFKTEHAEFPMDPRRSPGWVVSDHPKDQLANLLRCRSSSDRPPDLGDQLPVQTESAPVPTHDGFRRDDNEGLLPSRPHPPSDYPEELIGGSEARARMSALQRDELLTQNQILEKEALPLAKEANQYSEAEPYETKHGVDL